MNDGGIFLMNKKQIIGLIVAAVALIQNIFFKEEKEYAK